MSVLDWLGFYVVPIYFLKGDHIAISLIWCAWEAACLITVELSREVGDCHIYMVCLSLVLVCGNYIMESSYLVMVVFFVDRVHWSCCPCVPSMFLLRP